MGELKSMLCSICIASYKRPEGLKKLLKSIVQLKIRDDVEIEIIITDNDVDQTAKPVYHWFIDKYDIIIKYYLEKQKNISLARNLLLSKANGEYILFIDDDETADPEWLAQLLLSIEKYEADAVFGQVQFYFDPKTPKWIQDCYLFHPDDDMITGENATLYKTGNVIIRASALKPMDTLFDPDYGTTGGDDMLFFCKLNQKGTKFINCAEACTKEYVPSHRSNVKWLLRRAMAGGNNHTRVLLELKGSNLLWIWAHQFVVGLTQMIIAFLLSILYSWNRTYRLNWLCKSFANFGKIMALLNAYP